MITIANLLSLLLYLLPPLKDQIDMKLEAFHQNHYVFLPKFLLGPPK